MLRIGLRRGLRGFCRRLERSMFRIALRLLFLCLFCRSFLAGLLCARLSLSRLALLGFRLVFVLLGFRLLLSILVVRRLCLRGLGCVCILRCWRGSLPMIVRFGLGMGRRTRFRGRCLCGSCLFVSVFAVCRWLGLRRLRLFLCLLLLGVFLLRLLHLVVFWLSGLVFSWWVLIYKYRVWVWLGFYFMVCVCLLCFGGGLLRLW